MAANQVEWKSPYEQWMEDQRIPIYQALGGVEDITELPRRPWARLGGNGTFISLRGTVEGGRGLYVCEIPPGKALELEKHLYEKVIYIIQGRGLTEIWQDGERKQTFEWGQGSVFAPPLNVRHRLVNGGREPVLFLAITNAPEIIDLFHNLDFVFNNDFVFKDRYGGQTDYFTASDKRYRVGLQNIWETNFIPNVDSAGLEDLEQKVSGGQLTQFEMAGNSLIGHISEWPAGRYHKAHWHGPGAVLVGLKSEGYVLLWPREVGIHPFQDGYEDQVVVVNWKRNSIYSPPDAWFHQHFNTGRERARHLAIRYGSRIHRQSYGTRRSRGEEMVYTSVKEGGSLINYEDEDPEIRRRFEEALRKSGVEMQMPAVVYSR